MKCLNTTGLLDGLQRNLVTIFWFSTKRIITLVIALQEDDGGNLSQTWLISRSRWGNNNAPVVRFQSEISLWARLLFLIKPKWFYTLTIRAISVGIHSAMLSDTLQQCCNCKLRRSTGPIPKLCFISMYHLHTKYVSKEPRSINTIISHQPSCLIYAQIPKKPILPSASAVLSILSL